MRFTKMQGLGNDYIYILGPVPENVAELSVRLSDRHFGIGGDGLVFITPSSVADFGMRIFNADGSEARMCGNGIRCVGKFVYDQGLTKSHTVVIETQSGLRTLTLHTEGSCVDCVSVDMGPAQVDAPVTHHLEGQPVLFTPVNMGNPHVVAFVPDAEEVPLALYGPMVEESYPGGVNVEFVSVQGANRLRMRVWERGSGITMACGTGACASAAAAIARGLCDEGKEIVVQLDGGFLSILVPHTGSLTMKGPAVTVFSGTVE